ncbi:DUF2336 domain-containing protein [Bradyrhizobium sp.]|uniref:DUF2336 domain-containing protein n=1 Tax=Bradyrhizobium sp. TaxID=376 RepID=UPI003C749F3C
MLQQPANSIIAELEDAVRSGSPEKRVGTLRQVTDLFLHDGERLSEDQVKVFDDVLCLLVSRVESRARAELGARLAPLDYAPFEVIQHLARDNDIAVAGNVLTSSSRLRTSDLVEIASSKGQDHLLAISGRTSLPEAVTDVIVDRGERNVIRKLANNSGARFSETGYSKIVARSEADAELIEILGLRVDLPLKFLRELLRRATDAVRARLAAVAPPELQEEIKRILKAIAGAVRENARDFSAAEALVKLLRENNELDGAAIIKFLEASKFDEVAASLALLGNAPTEMMARLLEGPRSDLILIPCKAAGLDWAAVEAILCKRPVRHPIDERTLKLALQDYNKLSLETARRTLRFWQVHNRLEK